MLQVKSILELHVAKHFTKLCKSYLYPWNVYLRSNLSRYCMLLVVVAFLMLLVTVTGICKVQRNIVANCWSESCHPAS